MLDVLDWVKRRIDDTAALQKARPARIDARPDQQADPLTTLADLIGRLKAAGGVGNDAKARSALLASIQDEAAVPIAALVGKSGQFLDPPANFLLQVHIFLRKARRGTSSIGEKSSRSAVVPYRHQNYFFPSKAWRGLTLVEGNSRPLPAGSARPLVPG